MPGMAPTQASSRVRRLVGCGLALTFGCGDSDSDGDADDIPIDGPGGDSATPVLLGDVYASTKGIPPYGIGWGRGGDLEVWSALPTVPGDNVGCAPGSSPHASVIAGEAARTDGFVYLVAEDQGIHPRGVIAELVREEPQTTVQSGGLWETCALAIDQVTLPGSDAADRLALDAAIKACDAGDTRSGGWVSSSGPVTAGATGRLAVGESNDGDGGHFQTVCDRPDHELFGVTAGAAWMWYAPPAIPDPFATELPDASLVVFRLPFEEFVVD